MHTTASHPIAIEDTSSEEIASEQKAPKSQATRYHDMDSLRAAMMLLGLVFHAAWFFQPLWFGHTLSDSGAGIGYSYFFNWVHQFRMQVFFLIAGFFACLLINKRGYFGFAKNRTSRVILPFALAMLTIFPLMKLQMIRGGLISGRIISDESVWTQFWTAMTTIDWPNEWPIHLWFLETLVLIYGIAILLWFAFEYALDRSGKLRRQLSELLNRVTTSHFGPFVLAIPVGACIAYDLTWLGIDTGPLKPLWAGVLAYWVFFAVGWCLFSNPKLIETFVGRWPAYLLIGSVLSFGLTGYFNRILMDGRISWFYPLITDSEIDYPSLRSKLLAAADEADPDPSHLTVWQQLSPTYQEFVRTQTNPNSDQLTGFTTELTMAIVFNPEFSFDQAADLSGTESDPIENRETLSQVTQGAVFGKWPVPMWIRTAYFYGYGLATWLMTFAMLGLFRRFFSNPSAGMRYLADSSYWLYLIHLPIQFELSLYLAPWEANSFLKFLIYNLLTFALTIPTYHYLVRSTWLGKLLNGRTYSRQLASPTPAPN